MKISDKRSVDINGYWSLPANPISKVGVFPYMGSEIGAPEPDRIYKVYRSADELSSAETIASFNLLPLIDDHEFLGTDGTPAEKKGVQGTTGETTSFDAPYLKNNLRVYSQFLQDLITSGKTELSPSYRCDYDFTAGVFDGESYDAIQRNIRGNHLALVQKGRTGPDVAVQDCYSITSDSVEFITMEFTPEQLAQLKGLIVQILAEQAGSNDEKIKEEKPEDAEVAAPVSTEEKAAVEATAEEADNASEAAASAVEAISEVQTALEAVQTAAEEVKAAPTADSYAKLKAAMDKLTVARKPATPVIKALDAATVIKQIASRDALAERLKKHTGAFAMDGMFSEADVAKYGVKKLGIKAQDGAEVAVLNGYLQAARPATERIVNDSAPVRGEHSADKLWKGK